MRYFEWTDPVNKIDYRFNGTFVQRLDPIMGWRKAVCDGAIARLLYELIPNREYVRRDS